MLHGGLAVTACDEGRLSFGRVRRRRRRRHWWCEGDDQGTGYDGAVPGVLVLVAATPVAPSVIAVRAPATMNYCGRVTKSSYTYHVPMTASWNGRCVIWEAPTSRTSSSRRQCSALGVLTDEWPCTYRSGHKLRA